MMKRITYILLAGSLLLLGSCKKYLDTVPDDVLTIDDIFSSKENTEKYLANIYYNLPNEMEQRFTSNENSGPWEASSDDAKYNWDFNYSNNMNKSVWSNTDGTIGNFWRSYYQAIRKATDFMGRIDGANANEITLSTKKIYKAEARGLRAIFYLNLLKAYGPVVLIGDNLIAADASPDDVRLPRSNFDDCVNFVVSQLDSAYLDLPTIPTNKQYGRITKGVVKAYKVEALMFAASPLYNGNTDLAALKNTDGEQLISQTFDVNKWKKTADAAKAFFNEFVPGTYGLYKITDPDPFMSAYLSCRDVVTDDWNKEWIFARANSGSFMRYDRTPKHVGAPSSQQGAGAMGVTQTMVDAYFMANGRSIDDPQSGYVASGFSDFKAPFDVQNRTTYNQWINREPRFYVGVTYNNSLWLYQDNGTDPIITNMQYSGNSGRSQSTSDVSPTGYVVRKNAATNDNGRGALLLRLGNIYLDYAEALNEYDPTNSDIVTYLNLIRDRAGVPIYGSGVNDLPIPSGQAEMRTAIRKERRVELAFENNRYFDTRRWKIAEQTDAGPFYGMNMYVNGDDFYKKTLLETRVFQKRDYFMPIPNNEVLKNNLLVQNPGW
ncbi:RagB/SusD family nutrient uptake outer membrane protein [soil metagenome]